VTFSLRYQLVCGSSASQSWWFNICENGQPW